ncbi:MAG: Fic family protein [Planctomycetes bacterium]|nr:Fic family protein [Planctomycetota bacterium]
MGRFSSVPTRTTRARSSSSATSAPPGPKPACESSWSRARWRPATPCTSTQAPECVPPRAAISELERDLVARGQATGLFGREREQSLASLLGNLDQSVLGKPAYGSVEASAAHLLYFVIKNHPFADGNNLCARSALRGLHAPGASRSPALGPPTSRSTAVSSSAAPSGFSARASPRPPHPT